MGSTGYSFEAICLIKSQTLLEYPNSLSYQEINLTNVGFSPIQASASKTEESVDPLKSDDTTMSSVYPRMPFSFPFAASDTAFFISSIEAPCTKSRLID